MGRARACWHQAVISSVNVSFSLFVLTLPPLLMPCHTDSQASDRGLCLVFLGPPRLHDHPSRGGHSDVPRAAWRSPRIQRLGLRRHRCCCCCCCCCCRCRCRQGRGQGPRSHSRSYRLGWRPRQQGASIGLVMTVTGGAVGRLLFFRARQQHDSIAAAIIKSNGRGRKCGRVREEREWGENGERVERERE